MTTAATSAKKPRTAKAAAKPAAPVAVLGLESNDVGEVSEEQLMALLDGMGDEKSVLSAAVASDTVLIPADAPVVVVEAAQVSMLDDLLSLDAEAPAIDAAGDGKDPSAIPNPEPTPAPVTAAGDGKDPSEIPAEPKKPAAPRTPVLTTRSAKIHHRLGDKASEYLILDTKDAELSEKELKTMQAELMALFDGDKFPKKVGEKATMLFGYLRNGGKLNEIMRRAFTTLIKDGELVGGNKGNLIENFLSKPYSIGTAQSQATQMFALFPLLKICFPRAGGKMAINPDSTIIAKMRAELGI